MRGIGILFFSIDGSNLFRLLFCEVDHSDPVIVFGMNFDDSTSDETRNVTDRDVKRQVGDVQVRRIAGG